MSGTSTTETVSKQRIYQRRWFKIITRSIIGLFTILFLWIALDLSITRTVNLRQFDAAAMAKLETDMWRAYYDKKAATLYWRLVETLRKQSGLPFWQANLNAYRAARAAMLFKKGKSRNDYNLALPHLESYFRSLAQSGQLTIDSSQVAQLELEWWIVHRERNTYGKEKLITAIADATGAFYGVQPIALQEYASARAEAMLQRDDRAQVGNMNEADWQEIEAKLVTSYRALHKALN
jgi:hypothetical protein